MAPATARSMRSVSARDRVVTYSVNTGMKADESAPSATSRRRRFGRRNATKKASVATPAPKARAITRSRRKPRIRLARVAVLTTAAARATARRAPVAGGGGGNSVASVPIGTSALTGGPPFLRWEDRTASIGRRLARVPRARRGHQSRPRTLTAPAEHGRLRSRAVDWPEPASAWRFAPAPSVSSSGGPSANPGEGGDPMANIKSAIKRIRTSEKRRVRNAAVRSTVRTSVKGARAAIEGGPSRSSPRDPAAHDPGPRQGGHEGRHSQEHGGPQEVPPDAPAERPREPLARQLGDQAGQERAGVSPPPS